MKKVIDRRGRKLHNKGKIDIRKLRLFKERRTKNLELSLIVHLPSQCPINNIKKGRSNSMRLLNKKD